MTLDIRLPIGALFSLIGLMLVAQGLLAGGETAAAGSVNVDLWWGLVMGVFGVAMLLLARRRPGRRAGRDDRPGSSP